VTIPNIPRKETLIAGGVGLALALLLVAVILPLRSHTTQLDSRIARAQEQLAVVSTLAAEYREASASAPKAQGVKRGTGFTLFAFLEEAASRDGVKERIDFMRPGESAGEGGVREEIVEMRLSAIRLAQLVPFLHRIETGGEMVGVRRMTIRSQAKSAGLLDVDLTATAYKIGT
jgi:general secretion pathway protein M